MQHAALKLLSRHLPLMGTTRHREMFQNLTGMMTTTKNAPLRTEICRALEALVKQVGNLD